MFFKKITVRSGENTPYKYSSKADIGWYIISGEGIVLADGEQHTARPDNTFHFSPMQSHQVLARTDMVIIEVADMSDTEYIATRGFNGEL